MADCNLDDHASVLPLASDVARRMGGKIRRQGDKMTATIASVTDMAHFHHLLKRAGLEYRETFANGGKAIRFIFTDGPVQA